MGSLDSAEIAEGGPGAGSGVSDHGLSGSRGVTGLWRGALLAGLLAGAAAWLVGESGSMKAKPAIERFTAAGRRIEAATPTSRAAAAVRTAARVHGVFGALLGLALGAAGGCAGRSVRRASLGAAVGLASGAIVGASAAFWGIPLYDRLHDRLENDLLASLLMHGGLWGAIGGCGGFALGLGCGGLKSALRGFVGGVAGGLLGMVVYDIAGGLLFPAAETGHPISITPVTRLLARLLVASGAAFVAGLVLEERRRAAREQTGRSPRG